MTAKVHYADLWGLREIYEEDERGERQLTGGKYHWLSQHDVSTTRWTAIEPQAPFYVFTPQNVKLRDEYEEAVWKVADIFPVNSLGIATARDSLTIRFTEADVWRTVNDFASLDPEEARSKYDLGKDARDWQVALAQKDLNASRLSEDKIKPILYRPFDNRFTYYTGHTKGFHCMPRNEVSRHMVLGNNLGLSTTRSIEIGRGWEHIFCTSQLIQLHTVSIKEVNYLFPLYLYPDDERINLFDNNEPASAPGGRRANLAGEFVEDLAARLKMEFVEDGKGDLERTFGPEDVFSYMYAVFHSPEYRSRYAEFLKIDFPRLPLTSNPALFRALCAKGEELVGLHLMERDAPSVAGFPQPGDNTVEAVRYTAPETGESGGRVWINREQYFEGVPEEVWNFHVGGYQVCQKWLKDRKGRKLTYDDLTHYRRITAALAATLRLMAEIDETIEANGGWPLA